MICSNGRTECRVEIPVSLLELVAGPVPALRVKTLYKMLREAVFGNPFTGDINTRALQAILTFHSSMSTHREINMTDSEKALRADRINQKPQIIPEHCPLLQPFSPAGQQKWMQQLLGFIPT